MSAAEDTQSDSARQWLVLPSIDVRGRQPLRADAVLARVLSGAPPPQAGEELTGTSGSGAWEERSEGADGRLGGGSLGVAYRRFSREAERVVLLRLVGASTALINGVGYAGDLYGYGWSTQLVPLRAGANDVYVSGIRGSFALSFVDVPGPLQIGPWDSLVPDLLLEESGQVEDGELLMGVLVFHADPKRHGRIFAAAKAGDVSLPAAMLGAPYLAPLAQRKLPLRLDLGDVLAGAERGSSIEVLVRVTVMYEDGPSDQREVYAEHVFQVPVRAATELHRRTFLSHQDLTVQEYCVRPPAAASEESRASEAAESGEPARLLLSLHGAGVHAWNQAGSYPALPGFWHVAATNRRPFGFDWQDWGRADAYEVLEHALGWTGVSRRYVYLGGHSMGGHGTWHLGANDPDGFAALAPSAGWRSFDTYGRGRPDTELAWLWSQGDLASDTEALLSNLVQIPTYVLHSDADESVPISEAEAMLAALTEAGAAPRAHFEPDRGHWWDAGVGAGVDCLAWPGFYELFRNVVVPAAPREIDFTTVHPSVDAKHHWVEVLQLETYGEPGRVRGLWTPEQRRIELQLENVLRLRVEAPGWNGVDALLVDGEQLALSEGAVELVRSGDGWTSEAPRPEGAGQGSRSRGPSRKSPAAGGPFKRAFDRNFLFVLPTKGSAAETEAALASARYHQSVWRYRGNGDAALMRDVDLAQRGEVLDVPAAGRNLVLFGNEHSNAAWRDVVRGLAHLRITPGSIRVGERVFQGDDLTCLAVVPGQRDPEQLIALVGTTGAAASGLAPVQNLFISGAGFPDYVVFGPDVLTSGDKGVRAAGWFDANWGMQEQHAYSR